MPLMSKDADLETVEAIYDALDAGRPDEAWALARAALTTVGDDDAVLHVLAGRALVELDRPDEAVARLERAVELDPEDPDFRADLAEALFLACRFDDAAQHARHAVGLEAELPDAHYLLALVLERRGRFDQAERHFERAAAGDAERYPLPCRVGPEEFGRQLEIARAALPEEFRAHLDRIGVIVEDLPPDELLNEERPPLTPELLGLFCGVTIEGRSHFSVGGELPPRIYLFKRNLERNARRPDELAEQIRVTLYHELGHYLGMEEDDLDDAGYA